MPALGQAYTTNLIHLVFSTKERRPIIPQELLHPLWEDFVGIGHNHKMIVYAAGGMRDHAHLLFNLPSTLCVSDAARIFKANSSRFLGEHGVSFSWQEGYGAFGVSESNKTSVVNYIATQAEHHKTRSFAEEFIALLKKHNVGFDPTYVLG
jgi:putative transposase